MEQYSLYYQAKMLRAMIWFVAGSLRNLDHVVLERTIDSTLNIIEFFVAADQKEEFEYFMNIFQQKGYVIWWEAQPNRFSRCTDSIPEQSA